VTSRRWSSTRSQRRPVRRRGLNPRAPAWSHGHAPDLRVVVTQVATNSRGKSLRVVAGPAGMSNKLPVPAPCNGDTDAAVEAVRLALMAISRKRPREQVVGLEELQARAQAVESSDYQHRGEMLPDLIRDLHTSIMAGHDPAELLELAVLVHAQTTRGWLYVVGAPLDLRREPTTLAHRTPDDLDEPDHAGRRGVVIEMVATGAFDLLPSVQTTPGQGLLSFRV